MAPNKVPESNQYFKLFLLDNSSKYSRKDFNSNWAFLSSPVAIFTFFISTYFLEYVYVKMLDTKTYLIYFLVLILYQKNLLLFSGNFCLSKF